MGGENGGRGVQARDPCGEGDDAVTHLQSYHDLIAKKRVAFEARGLKKWGDLPSTLFDHQRHGVEFVLRSFGNLSDFFYDALRNPHISYGRWITQAIKHLRVTNDEIVHVVS
jgi:hypothetical protein